MAFLWLAAKDKKEFTTRTGYTWLPDQVCHNCSACDIKFSTFVRRHHCRLCGQIFCHRCSAVVVDDKRACVFCFVEHIKPGFSSSAGGNKPYSHKKALKRGNQRTESDDAVMSERSTLPSFKYEISRISEADLYQRDSTRESYSMTDNSDTSHLSKAKASPTYMHDVSAPSYVITPVSPHASIKSQNQNSP